MKAHFFAMINRMKLINRWGLMRNTVPENISEHSHQVAVIAHALAEIGNREFGASYHAERAALLALYHDATEILTGDMPTPVKYQDQNIIDAYKEVERRAGQRMLAMLPETLRDSYTPLFIKSPQDASLWKLVKAADTLSALIKSMEEVDAGNLEFTSALQAITRKVMAIDLPEATYFVEHFLPSYTLTLDEHTK